MAIAAAVVFQKWTDEDVIAEYTVVCSNIEAYVPGSFYRRELPCLLAVLGRVVEPLDIVIVDGYVSLGDKPGMGMELWEALNRQRPIIGVAKTSFHGARAAEVLRGKAKVPLFVTAAGIDVIEAASNIGRMAGSFRVPSLLKRVDRVAREELKRSSQLSPK